jgi:hypothetical protein
MVVAAAAAAEKGKELNFNLSYALCCLLCSGAGVATAAGAAVTEVFLVCHDYLWHLLLLAWFIHCTTFSKQYPG